MKWAILAFALIAIAPVVAWLRANPVNAKWLWVLIGFLPFSPIKTYMALESWAYWPGYVKGLELSLLDLVAVALYLTLPRTPRRTPFRVVLFLYFATTVFSTLQTNVPMATAFSAWQLARMIFLFLLVARGCSTNERTVHSILMGMGAGLCIQAVYVISQRFGGVLQPGGTFGHQNLLGMASHFVVFPIFALLLAGNYGRLMAVVPLAGAIAASLTASRATIGLAGIGYTMVFGLSAIRGWTPRKAKFAMASLLALAAIAPLAYSSFERRFSEAPEAGTYDERAVMEAAASMMLSDRPMGVGANQYIVVANTQNYNSRAGVAWTSGSANVHNVYLLVAAETGYVGLAAFAAVLIQPLIVAFLYGWRNKADRRGDLLLGLAVSLFVVYVHGFYEWIFVTWPIQYLFAITAGIVAGLARQLGYARQANRLHSTAAADNTAKGKMFPSPASQTTRADSR